MSGSDFVPGLILQEKHKCTRKIFMSRRKKLFVTKRSCKKNVQMKTPKAQI